MSDRPVAPNTEPARETAAVRMALAQVAAARVWFDEQGYSLWAQEMDDAHLVLSDAFAALAARGETA